MAKKLSYPLGIQESDLKYPRHDDKDQVAHSAGDYGRVVLHECAGRRNDHAWIVATLGISRGSRGSDRTYGVRVDTGTVCRVGNGPHVLRTITVYVRQSRLEALKPLLELRLKGLAEAGMIRDRIGSRRAEGQLRRAQGQHSWMWDN